MSAPTITENKPVTVEPWEPPPGQLFEDVEDAALPGMPKVNSVTKRAVVYPKLHEVTVLEISVACPKCGAGGSNRDPGAINALMRGGGVRVDCSQCGLPIILRRPPEQRIVLAGGPTPEQKASFDRLMNRGKSR